MRAVTVAILIACALRPAVAHSQGGTHSTSAGAAAAPPFVTANRSLAIPFSVDPSIRQAVEVQLFVSTDAGTTWQLSSRQRPDARQFLFTATADGSYWFASRTFDEQNRAIPSGDLRPELQIVVDSVKPQLELEATVLADGRLQASWRAFDPNLAPDSLRLEYQAGAAAPWKPVSVEVPRAGSIETTYAGESTWTLDASALVVNVRVEIRDTAGNQAVANRRLIAPRIPDRLTGRSSASDSGAPPADPYARYASPDVGATPWPPDLSPDGSGGAVGATPPFSPSGSFVPASQLSLPERGAPPVSGAEVLPPPAVDTPAPAARDQWAGGGTTPYEPFSHPVSQTVQRPSDADLGPAARPQLTPSRLFELDYDVSGAGPAGVAEVELWATRDGRVWNRFLVDPDAQSPFRVEVAEDGAYGFRVVVVGNNGLAGRPPQPGDPADLWVAVDSRLPLATLTSAVYGEGHQAGQLIIRWEASDENLGPRPVTLAYGERPDGPWTTIAAGIPNDGKYAWRTGTQLPEYIYLMLEVRDEAGNVSTHRLDEPLRADGLAPKAQIRSLRPVDAGRQALNKRGAGSG